MFTRAVPENLKGNLEKLGTQPFIKQFYLAGGTAIALQLGHRISYDLDFFTRQSFDARSIITILEQLGKVTVSTIKEDTLLGELNNVKISFFWYRYPLLNNPELWEGVPIASCVDVGCMKLDAIQSRGAKRDFIDLWRIMQAEISLAELFGYFEKKYEGVTYNKMHLLQSLTYFEDAEKDQMPDMIEDIAWETVKKFFVQESKKLMEEKIK